MVAAGLALSLRRSPRSWLRLFPRSLPGASRWLWVALQGLTQWFGLPVPRLPFSLRRPTAKGGGPSPPVPSLWCALLRGLGLVVRWWASSPRAVLPVWCPRRRGAPGGLCPGPGRRWRWRLAWGAPCLLCGARRVPPACRRGPVARGWPVLPVGLWFGRGCRLLFSRLCSNWRKL